jgi:hypothetical protein
MAAASDRFDAAVAAIDAVNAADPHCVEIDGVSRAKEVVHAERMTRWVQRLDPDADEAQLLAARAHHLRRWAVPRHTYPEGRAGYLRWRADQKKRHAAEVAEILAGVGYAPELIERVGQIVRKERLRSDPAVQVHEAALCLVFLELQFSETAQRLGDEQMVSVLAKTLAKMSDQGKQAAMDLQYPPEEAGLLQAALRSHQEPAGGH